MHKSLQNNLIVKHIFNIKSNKNKYWCAWEYIFNLTIDMISLLCWPTLWQNDFAI